MLRLFDSDSYGSRCVSRADAGLRRTPAAVTRAAANGPRLQGINRAGREAADDDATRLRGGDGNHPVAGADFILHLIRPRIDHGLQPQGQLGADTVVNAQHQGRVERRLRAVGARGLEARGDQQRQVLRRHALHIGRNLPQRRDEHIERDIFGRRCQRSALRRGRELRQVIRLLRAEDGQRHWQGRETHIAREGGDDGVRVIGNRRVGQLHERVTDSVVSCHTK